MKEHGDTFIDVFCDNLIATSLKEGLCFDSDKDQKDPSLRKLVTETVRLRKEFVEAEKVCKGKSTVVRKYCDSLSDTSDEM